MVASLLPGSQFDKRHRRIVRTCGGMESAMVTNKLFAPVVLLAALSLTALPAAAGQGRSRENHGDRGKAVAQATQRQAAPRQSARQNESRQGQASRSETRREQGSSRQAAPQQSARRQNESRQQAPRYAPRPNQAPPSSPRAEPGRAYAVPRGTYDRRDNRPADRDGRRYDGSGRYDRDNRAYRRSYGPSYRPSYRPYYRPYYYRPHYFARPYFAFRPRLTIGFGLWLGYPVPYPYAYVGGYAPGLYGSVGVVRGVSVYGGLSFDISPYDAAVFVDGQYVGTVADFPPNAPPLTLTPGVYRIEVQASGYRPMVWDVTIVPGQVIPYRGAMQPY
jgi:hypothetical protein